MTTSVIPTVCLVSNCRTNSHTQNRERERETTSPLNERHLGDTLSPPHPSLFLISSPPTSLPKDNDTRKIQKSLWNDKCTFSMVLTVFSASWLAVLACRPGLPCWVAVLACPYGLPCWVAVRFFSKCFLRNATCCINVLRSFISFSFQSFKVYLPLWA